MKRHIGLLMMALLLLAFAMPTAAQDGARTGYRPDAPAFGVDGPFPVGFRSFMLARGDAPRTAGMWYPAVQHDGEVIGNTYDLGVGDLMPAPMNTLEGHALSEGEFYWDDGPYPLIIASHGAGSSYMLMAYQYEHLASHGFVVFAFDHSRDNLRGQMSAQTREGQRAFMDGMVDSLVMRPMDVTQAIDFIEDLSQDGVYARMIDLERIAVHGLSYGGYTALLEAGVRLDFSETSAYCGESAFRSSLAQAICAVYGTAVPDLETRLAEVAGAEVTPGEPWPSLADPRVDAVVAISPGGGLALISEAGLAMVDKPMLILAATADVLANPAFNALRVWEHAQSTDRVLAMFENAGHMFAAECSPAMSAAMPICVDPVWDAARARDLSNHFVTAFLRAELYADEAARAALAPDAVAFPGITYEAEGF